MRGTDPGAVVIFLAGHMVDALALGADITLDVALAILCDCGAGQGNAREQHPGNNGLDHSAYHLRTQLWDVTLNSSVSSRAG